MSVNKTISINTDLIKQHLSKTKRKRPSLNSRGTQRNQKQITVPNATIKKDKPYGIMKNGSKPTFREWKTKTQKKRSIISKLVNARSNRKHKHIFGKNLHNRTVSVLIKNNKTRKKQKKDIEILDKKPIVDVKKYLLKNSMLKSNSSAPDDVLREMYKELHMTGDVVNTNNNILLHNYFS